MVTLICEFSQLSAAADHKNSASCEQNAFPISLLTLVSSLLNWDGIDGDSFSYSPSPLPPKEN